MEYNTVQCCIKTLETIDFNANSENSASFFLASFGTGPVWILASWVSGKLEVWWVVLVALVLVTDILGMVSMDLKFYKIQAI